MTPNEVRLRESLPPDPNGDQLMMSRDLMPVDILVNHPEMLLTGGRGVICIYARYAEAEREKARDRKTGLSA